MKCNSPVDSRPGYVRGPGYVVGLMGLSVTRSKFRSLAKNSRWRNVQDLLIKERLDEVVIREKFVSSTE